MGVFLVFFGLNTPLYAQISPEKSNSRQTRLILNDGSYQIVRSYTVKGNVVRYKSVDRGSNEEIPANLIDWDATRAWEQAHAGSAMDSELQQLEDERAARSPEVLPNLKLPEFANGVYALDIYRGTSELVGLTQSDGDLNKQTAHNILKATVNPFSSSHQLVQLKGTSAAIQLHTSNPSLYILLDSDEGQQAGGGAMHVDTKNGNMPVRPNDVDETPSHPARLQPLGGGDASTYVIVRADVRKDVRVVSSFKISMLGQASRQTDVIETKMETMPGGLWMKLTPLEPLEPGEYALMEVLSAKDVNMSVWDFGVHREAPENAGALLPVEKKPLTLKMR